MNFIGDIIRAGIEVVTTPLCMVSGGHKWIQVSKHKIVCEYCGKVA